LAGLDVPSADAPCSAGDCQRYSAVRLFVERAQLADHRFELDAVRAPVVVEICRKLDGIPLAIEIGAAQMRILDAGELRRALDDRLASLSSGLADVPRRQQTLTAAIGWSYDLLDVRERSVFRRLATFAGGCSVEAAAGVCGGSGVDASALPAVLDALVDKSFVGVDGRSGARRYVLLESARQFGLAMLRTHDEYESAAMRQAQWAATFAQSMLRSSLTLPRDAWDVQFAREFDNLYAALHRMLEPGRDVSVAARILGGLRPYWSTRGGRAESYRLAIEVLDRLDVGKHPELAAGLHLVCSYYSFGADRLRSVRLATELYTQARSAFELARCYKQLAHAYSELGHLRKALQALGWASTFMTVCGIPDRQRMLQVCELRADLLQRHGSLDEARAQYRAGIDLAREFGDAVIEESCLASLAELDYFAGRLDAAIATFRHLVLSKHEAFRMHVYGHLSACYLQVGNVRAATESARIALAAEDALPLTRLVAIERLAHVATLTNDPIRAARLRGFVNEQFRRFEFVRDSFGSACAQTLSDALGERLTPDKIAVHARRGAKLSFERAVLEATPASTPERRSEILDVASADRPRQL
jgi:tetratricopeptide (TPR) repeat protein